MKNPIFKDMKPCPFCGSDVQIKNIVFSEKTERIESMELECPECGGMSFFSPFSIIKDYNSKDRYFDVWQKRNTVSGI